mmetsp:Transcript_19705/g.49803  ORF Transcript_19705/g.49803 Transcript_19705/m.49803 type:complete len:117 (+) Transcript_19705:186-536(+)
MAIVWRNTLVAPAEAQRRREQEPAVNEEEAGLTDRAIIATTQLRTMVDWRNPFNNTYVTGEVNALQRGPMFLRWGKVLARRAPFVLPAAAGGAWLVYPALTPQFKGRWGLGPKVEE